MELSNLITEENINLSLDASSKDEVITKIAEMMAKTGFVSDVNTYKEVVLQREEKGSTGVGFGVAIPHGKSAGVSKPGLAFARITNPVEWQSLDDKPVSIVFMIGVPEEHAGNEHLSILSALSRKLIHEDFREQLMNATTAGDVINILKTV